MHEASAEFSTKKSRLLHVLLQRKVANSIFSLGERAFSLLFRECPVGANAVAPLAFCPVKGGIGDFDELDRVARIVRKRCDAYTYRHVVPLGRAAVPYNAELLFRDRVADPFRGD